MSRKEVENVLDNVNLTMRACLNPIDEFYETFQSWIKDMDAGVQKFIAGKCKGPHVLTTRTTSLCNHSRLSVIRESPGIGESRNTFLKPSKNVAAKYKHSLKSRSKRSKRISSTYEEEPEDQSDVAKTSERLSRAFTGLEPLQESSDSKCENVENNGGVSCESKSAPIRKGRRTNQSYDLKGRDESVPVRRITRSNAPRKTHSENSSKNGDKSLVPQTFSSVFVDEACNVVEESTSKTSLASINEGDGPPMMKKGRAKGRKTHQKTLNSESNRSNAPQKTRSENFSKNGDKSLVPQTFSSVFVDESCNVVEESTSKTSLASTNEGDGPPMMKKGRAKGRKTRQKTLNSEGNREPSVDTEKKNLLITKQVDNEKCVVSSTKRSTRVNASEAISEIVKESSALHQIDAQDVEANLDMRLCQDVSGSIVKVDNLINSSNTVVVSEDMLTPHKTTVQKIISTSIDIQENQKTIVQKDCIDNTRKRSRSNVIDNHPPKKSHLNAYSDEIGTVNEIDFQKESRSISQTRKTHKITVQNEDTFSQISPLHVSDMKKSEDIFIDQETGKDVGINKQKMDSGRGNSITSNKECSIHSSSGSKVDADTIPQNEKKNEEVGRNSVVLRGTQTRQSMRLEKPKMQSRKSPTREIQVSCKKGFHPSLFSPYANEPVKNRVAAYEVLSNIHEEIEIPPSTKRVTRTKTRAMAAAAAAAAAKSNKDLEPENKKPRKNSNGKYFSTQKLTRASVRLAKSRLNAAMKRNDFGKENSFNSSAQASKFIHSTPMTGKILSDLNGLSSSQLNSSRKTPMTASTFCTVNSINQLSKSGMKPGVVITTMESFIKRPLTKTAEDSEQKRIEEIRKREEKEKEALRRREENMKRLAEEKKKKRDEMMQRVKEKREAQEKEKQQIQIRIEKQKNEKWNNIQHEREVIVKEKTLKKKLETEKKAAESRRKLEEAEAARIAKKKLEEQQKRELEEGERIRNIAEKNEAATKREIFEKKMKEMQLCKEMKDKQNVSKYGSENLNHTSSTSGNDLNLNLNLTASKVMNSTFNIPSVPAEKSNNKKKMNNVYNLEDLPSDDSDVEDNSPKRRAYWASSKAELLKCSKRETYLITLARDDFSLQGDLNLQEIFPNKRLRKRTSSAIWRTPPRYSTLPKY